MGLRDGCKSLAIIRGLCLCQLTDLNLILLLWIGGDQEKDTDSNSRALRVRADGSQIYLVALDWWRPGRGHSRSIRMPARGSEL